MFFRSGSNQCRVTDVTQSSRRSLSDLGFWGDGVGRETGSSGFSRGRTSSRRGVYPSTEGRTGRYDGREPETPGRVDRNWWYGSRRRSPGSPSYRSRDPGETKGVEKRVCEKEGVDFRASSVKLSEGRVEEKVGVRGPGSEFHPSTEGVTSSLEVGSAGPNSVSAPRS